MIMKRSAYNLHVGLIGDGVRRWAKLNQIKLDEAYELAMKNIGDFIDFFFTKSAKIISLYLLSKDNLNRRRYDLDAAIKGETLFVRTLLSDLVRKWDCGVYLSGNPEIIPKEYLIAIQRLIETSNRSSEKKIYLLVGYCPFEELKLTRASNTEEIIKNLWVKESVDLVIRTSGEFRLSKFLPLQTCYSELFFLKKHINELTTKDCDEVLTQYLKRERRFGR